MNRDTALWTPILAAPTVWFVCMEANFALAPWACAFQWKFVMYIVSAVGLAITAALALMAYTEWKSVGLRAPGDQGGVVARSQIMALLGMLISAVAFLVTLAQLVPQLILGACQ